MSKCPKRREILDRLAIKIVPSFRSPLCPNLEGFLAGGRAEKINAAGLLYEVRAYELEELECRHPAAAVVSEAKGLP